MDETILVTLRQVNLGFVLGIVGLRSGGEVVAALTQSGLVLAAASIIIAGAAATCSFLFGRYVLKLNWILLSGAICGGTTSTPGLGAAADALKSGKQTVASAQKKEIHSTKPQINDEKTRNDGTDHGCGVKRCK
jgi:uncharacterized transporter YbjL